MKKIKKFSDLYPRLYQLIGKTLNLTYYSASVPYSIYYLISFFEVNEAKNTAMFFIKYEDEAGEMVHLKIWVSKDKVEAAFYSKTNPNFPGNKEIYQDLGNDVKLYIS